MNNTRSFVMKYLFKALALCLASILLVTVSACKETDTTQILFDKDFIASLQAVEDGDSAMNFRDLTD